jgi:hypothetical protein
MSGGNFHVSTENAIFTKISNKTQFKDSLCLLAQPVTAANLLGLALKWRFSQL